MCGIAGILKSKNVSLNLANIKSMSDGMSHRGPDDEGFAFFDRSSAKVWQFGGQDTPLDVYATNLPYTPTETMNEQAPYEATLAFGHRRLAILDLSVAGHQPMSTEDGRYWIVYNGEVYNFLEIREALEKEGEFFYSLTDTEVILKAYRRWGADCLKRFNGMWAFAIWDNHDKVLFCARDRIGIKPFYYYLTDDIFLFASDIKTLIASKLYPAEPDWEGVYHAMSFSCAPRPMTCFKGVRALEQAHWMTINLQGEVQKRRYWQMPVGEIDYSKSEAQWTEELEDTLRLAVKRRLVADVPVGTFMSGGIDSTTITAIAAQEHPGIKAFTLAFEAEAKGLDELSQAKATARMYELEHIVKLVRPEETLRYLRQMVHCYEEPFYSLAPNYVISKLVAENDVTVVLNGLGGDELFSGYNRHRFVKLWQMARPWRKVLTRWPSFSYAWADSFKEMLELKDIDEHYLSMFSIFTRQDKQQLLAHKIDRDCNSFTKFKSLYDLDSLDFSDFTEALCYFDVINYIGNHHVYRVDQFTMNFSLEGRFPLLDHELVELACRMPSRFKVNNRTGKYILRQVAKPLIDPSCLAMKKKGFRLPVGHWMQSSLKALVNEKINALKSRNIFDNKAIERTQQRFKQGKIRYPRLWFLVSVELWLEQLF